MMYRRNAAQQPRRGFFASVADQVWFAVASMMAVAAVYDRAWRENRCRARVQKRGYRHTTYQARGLNGDRALARRRRQIAAGSLTVANGLVEA